MKIIAGGRQTGRTTQLIEMAAEAEARGEVCYIVCHSQNEAYRIANLARLKELSIGFPLTYSEFIHRRYHSPHIHHIYIDNVEMLIQHLSIVPVAAITIHVEGGDALSSPEPAES